MEGLSNIGQGSDDQAQAWAKYLEELKANDPEEYELLIKDMQDFVKQKENAEKIVTKPGEGAGQEEEFTPRMPGQGNKVMGQSGVKVDDTESVRVDPVAGFVIKSKIVSENSLKLFINVTASPLIQKMSTKKQLADDGSEQEGINIPLSLGPPRKDRDNAGIECVVYDIVVNPEVLTNAKDDKTGQSRDFLCTLALQYVEQKYQCSVDYKYKLPKLDYKGDKNNIPYQLIRKRQAPVIEEVHDEPAKVASKKPQQQQQLLQQQQPAKRKLQQLAYLLEKFGSNTDLCLPCEPTMSDPADDDDEEDREIVKGLIFTCNLDPAVNMDKVKLDLAPEFLVLNVYDFYLPLEIYLPYPIDVENVTAKFLQGDRGQNLQLQAQMPVVEDRYWLQATHNEPDLGSKPWLLANALAFSEGPSPASSKPSTVAEVESPNEPQSNSNRTNPEDDTDTLPEDRFHLADMLSQHIKDERERERLEKIKRHEEEEEKKKQEEKLKKEAEKKELIAKLLQQAEKELVNDKNKLDLLSEPHGQEEDDDDLLV